MAELARARDDALWANASRWVEATLGLHFPRRLWPDLQRGMEAAARRLGLADAADCARRALAGELGREGRHAVHECLAIGETYFFRDPVLFEQLAQEVLRPLVARRRPTSRHLRLWSAGCSTGEEPYSLAMLVASLVPDWRDWNISVLGTDLNAAALRKARRAAYGRWSLRDVLPPACRPFLREGPDGKHHVDPQLRRIVRFEQLNLAEAVYPSPATLTTAMDLVLCRNVLIYFEPMRARAVLGRLGEALADEGWLVIGSVEMPAVAVPGLSVVRSDGLFALRRSHAVARALAAPSPSPPPPLPVAPAPPRRPRPGSAASPPASESAAQPQARPCASLSDEARRCADAGDLDAAERLCRRAIEQDKLDADAAWLLASIQLERGALDEAKVALRRTLYLAPGHLLARFCLGTLALRQGDGPAARRHLACARARLDSLPQDEVVPGSGGLTVRELEAAIRRAEETAP